MKAVIGLGPGMDGSEIVKRLAPPHAALSMQGLFEMDRLARAKGQEPIKVPIVSSEPGVQATMPSAESDAFFSQWEKNGSTWKNELTLRRSVGAVLLGKSLAARLSRYSLDDISTSALPMSHLENLTPTPIFFGVATRDTNGPPDMVMRQFGKLSEPKEYLIVDADHHELMSSAREILHPREVAFLKRSICSWASPFIVTFMKAWWSRGLFRAGNCEFGQH